MAIAPIQLLITARDRASEVFANLRVNALAVGAAVAAAFGVSIFKSAVDSAAEFEAQLSDVKAVSGATKDEMVLLRAAAEEAGSTTKFTATEAAEALGNLARSGLSAGQSIAALPATLSLAQAGSIDLAEASTLMTRTLAGFGLEATEAGRVADLLAMGANASNTSVTGLGEALSYAAPTASAMGISLESTLAIIGKFADGGIDASRAGTALNSILSQFGNPASSFRNELAAAGITTSNFETALVQLAGAGDKGKDAIRAVGTEAAPALQSLLNQGVPALEALRQKLVESGGSAAQFGKELEDNLTGATAGLGSAWDSLKIALGTPVLPILKDAVDSLAGSLRNAVSDGTVGKFGDAIAKGFEAAAEWARKFLAEVDFVAIAQSVGNAADQVGAAFDNIREKAQNAGDIVRLVWGAMTAGVNGVLTVVYGLGEAFAGVASNIQSGLALILSGLAKITFGDVSASFKAAANEMRLSAEATWAASQALGDKARQSFVDMSDGAQLARDGFAGLTNEMERGQPAATASAQAIGAVAKELQAVAEKNAEARRATEAKQAADENARVAVEQLRAEYEAAVNMGNWQLAAEKMQELSRVTQQVGTDAQQTAEEVEAAFSRMGIKTQASLLDAAENSRKDFETIRSSGQATADGLQQAFKRMADAAIASGDAGQLAFVRSQAAAQGFELATDSAGKTTVRAMSDAAAATGGAGRAADSAAGSYKRLGQSAADAAVQAAKLAAINERYSRPGENSQQKTSGEKDYDPGRGSPFSRPGEEPKNGNGLTSAEFQRKEKLKGQGSLDMSLQFQLLDKLQNKTLTAEDVPALKNVIASLNANQKTFDSISPGLNSLQALADDRKWQNAVQGFEQFVREAERPKPTPQNPAVERERADERETKTASATYISNITLPGGGTTRLSFSDANSQRDAEALMRQILAARGASS